MLPAGHIASERIAFAKGSAPIGPLIKSWIRLASAGGACSPNEGELMIDEHLTLAAAALLGTTAAMLIEDAHDQLVTRPLDASDAAALGATLSQLGDDLSALADAVRELTRRDV